MWTLEANRVDNEARGAQLWLDLVSLSPVPPDARGRRAAHSQLEKGVGGTTVHGVWDGHAPQRHT